MISTLIPWDYLSRSKSPLGIGALTNIIPKAKIVFLPIQPKKLPGGQRGQENKEVLHDQGEGYQQHFRSMNSEVLQGANKVSQVQFPIGSLYTYYNYNLIVHVIHGLSLLYRLQV